MWRAREEEREKEKKREKEKLREEKVKGRCGSVGGVGEWRGRKGASGGVLRWRGQRRRRDGGGRDGSESRCGCARAEWWRVGWEEWEGEPLLGSSGSRLEEKNVDRSRDTSTGRQKLIRLEDGSKKLRDREEVAGSRVRCREGRRRSGV